MWKPGQIITTCGNKYRLVKEKHGFVDCKRCSLYFSGMCSELCEEPHSKVPADCYLKEIKPKS